MPMTRQSATGRAVVGNRLIIIGSNHIHIEAQQGPATVDPHGARWRSMRTVAGGAGEASLDMARVLRPACARVDVSQIVALGA
jgi:hypothetical protein